MKKITAFVLLFFCFGFLQAQESQQVKNLKKLPFVDIKTLDGQNFNTKDISNDGKPVIISLWATWCKPCIAELMAIADVYDDWVEETGVKLYAISTDDAKSVARVAPFVRGRAWDYEVLLDQNRDFQRAMSVADVPFLCILNGNGEIVWQHTSYAPGSENEVLEVLKKLIVEK
jgi:thiol-disulfide isomerase/thioredoxin